MKRIFSICMLMFSSILLSSCSVNLDGINSNININLTQLPIPEITDESYDEASSTVTWNSISNCDGYTVKINNKEYNTSSLSYTVSFETSQLFTFSIKARGKNMYTTDSLWSDVFTWSYIKNGNDSGSKKVLSVPKNINYINNTIVWDSVENASSYEVEVRIDGQEPIIYNSSINYLTFEYYETIDFQYRVRAISEEGSQYSNSNWSVLLNGKYVHVDNGENYSDLYSRKGLGMSVNLFDEQSAELSFMTGTSIFDRNKIMSLKVGKRDIRRGNAEEKIYNSLDEAVSQNITDINAKLSVDLLKSGEKKIVSQKKLGISAEYRGVYEKYEEEKTKIISKSLKNYFQYEEIYFEGYRSNVNPFKDSLSSQFINDASELKNNLLSLEYSNQKNELMDRFINSYGTHIITAEILGSKLNKTYTLIGTEEAVNKKNQTDVDLNVHLSKNFVEVNADAGVAFDVNDYKSSSDCNVNMIIEFLGGQNAPFVASEESLDNNFINAYNKWVDSTNYPENNVMIDVADSSLICIWDLLSDDFSSLKDELNNYFSVKASKNYALFSDKIKEFYKEKVIDTDTRTKIYTKEELRDGLTNNADMVLKNDLDLGDYNWNPIESFTGSLDGAGYTIKNIKMDKEDGDKSKTKYGMIESFSGTIKNLNIIDPKIKVTKFHDNGEVFNLGAIAGYMYPGSLIENVHIMHRIGNYIHGYHDNDSKTQTTRACVGGFIGTMAGGTIKNCSIEYIDILGKARVNTTCQAILHNKCSTADVYSYVGGFVGYQFAGIIDNCIRYDNTYVKSVTISGSCKTAYHCLAGGITGYCEGGKIQNIPSSSIKNVTASPDYDPDCADSSTCYVAAEYNGYCGASPTV